MRAAEREAATAVEEMAAAVVETAEVVGRR